MQVSLRIHNTLSKRKDNSRWFKSLSLGNYSEEFLNNTPIPNKFPHNVWRASWTLNSTQKRCSLH